MNGKGCNCLFTDRDAEMSRLHSGRASTEENCPQGAFTSPGNLLRDFTSDRRRSAPASRQGKRDKFSTELL